MSWFVDDKGSSVPYKIHKNKNSEYWYITFKERPTRRFKIVSDVPCEDGQGNWRYKAQWVNGFVWVSVEVGAYGSKKMWEHFTDNVKLLKREKDVRIKFEEDWDKIYQLARKVLGV